MAMRNVMRNFFGLLILLALQLGLSTLALAQSALLNWNPSRPGSAAIAGYHVYRCPGAPPTCTFALIGSTPSTTYTDTGLSPVTQYSYKVTSYDVNGLESTATVPINITSLTGGDLPFSLPTGSVMHFMSPTGSDSNDGLAATTGGGHGPWASPNHAMNCGEVIIAAAGIYDGAMNNFGTVSNCPSSSGGIDGSGGIQAAVLLCGGSDLTSCVIDCATSVCHGDPHVSPQTGFNINQSFWSVQGWLIKGNAINNFAAYQVAACQSGTSITHHVSIINTVVYNGGQAFTPQDCGLNTNVPGNGADYVAIVGMVAQNMAQNTSFGICIAAIDVISPGHFGSTLDTHYFLYNNFTWNNLVPGCDAKFDGEDFMFDTIDNHGVVGKFILANNIGYYAERYCATYTYQARHVSAPTINTYNNTCYDNMQRDTAADRGAEILANLNPSIPWNINVFNNIAYNPHATPAQVGAAKVYAFLLHGPEPSIRSGAQVRTGAENIFFANAASCLNVCNTGSAPFSVSNQNGSNIGSDIYVNPNFKNTTDLISNHLGVPNCTGFVNTTACMGWNAATNSMTSLSVLDDLTAQCAQCTGKGFQLPSTTCVSSGDIHTDFPPWLKGLVYLHWNSGSSTITQKADLATKPCGM
jgi:hypothetical protein